MGDLKEAPTVCLNFLLHGFFLYITFKNGIAIAREFIPN